MVKKHKRSSFSILGSMLRRTIFNSWLQFFAIICITAIAVTLFIGLTSNAKSINTRVNTLYSNSNIADIWTTVTTYDEKDENKINSYIGEDGKTEKRYSLSSVLNSMEATALLSDELPTINAAYDTDNTATTNYLIIDKRLLDTETRAQSLSWTNSDGTYKAVPIKFSFSSIESMLSSTYVDEVHFPGKTYMDVFNLSLVENGKNVFNDSYLTMNMQITGTMMFAENVQSSLMNNSSFLLDKAYFKSCLTSLYEDNFVSTMPTDPTNPDFTFKYFIYQYGILDNIFSGIKDNYSYNQYCSKVGDNVDIKGATSSIESYFSSKDDSNLLMCIDKDNLSSNVTIQSDIVQAKQLAYIFPMIFFLVALLVVLTTLSQIILKERTQIGTMKAIGISKAQIFSHYMLMSMVVVLIGVVIGLCIGPFIISNVMNQKYDILYSLPSMVYTLAVPEALISTIGWLLLAGIVTFLVIRKEIVLKPAESMRPPVPKSLKTRNTVKETKLGTKTIPFKMAFRNIRVNIVKSLMVVVGVAGCTGLLVCGFGIDDTLNKGVDHDMNMYYGSDIFFTYNTNSSISDNILSVDGVKDVEEFSVLPTTIYGSSSYSSRVFILPDNCQYFVEDNDYEIKDKCAISQKVAESAGLSVGDIFSFQVLGGTYEAEVGAVFECFYVHGVFLNEAYSNYSTLYETKTNSWVEIKDGYTDTDVAQNIQDNVSGIASYKTKEQSRDMINSYMSSISLMTLTVKVFAILLAVVVLDNLALLNYKERVRDIATLKVLGFTRGEIAKSLIIEIMTLTIVGIGFGLLIGKPLEILVLMVNRTPIVEFLYTVYPLTYLYAFLITFIAAFAVNLLLSRKIKSVQMVESLKSIE